MRFQEFQSIKEKDSLNEDAVMAKIEQSGQIVRILKKQHIVPFSDEKNWLLIDTDPAKGNNGIGMKWIPANTRFAWVRPYRDTAEQDVAKEGYGDHPSQRVDPRTGKKYVPPKSPLKPSVADKSLNEENIIHLRDFNVTISLHAVDQADNRNINIRHIDNILKNISKVKSSIMGLSLGSQFILHNGKGTGIGVRKLDGNKLLLATVYNTPAGFVKGKHSTFKVDTSEITQIPEGSEKFNDEVMRPGFRWSEEINGITYLVRTRWDNMPEVIARVNNREVGRATFIDHQTRTGLESVSTYVSPKWQGHGIAKNMYAVMRMLGANIQPSATQTAMGKDMWAKWKKAGDTKHLTSMNAKMDTQGMAEGASNNLQTVIKSFVNSPNGQKYKKYDCKTVTRAFVQWAEQNKIPAQVVSLAPPSAGFIAKNPRYKGKSGKGDGHIMPVVNDNAIDFTVRQFGVSRPFENPLVTPTGSLSAVYGKFGYFTDKPAWFLGGKSHWIGTLKSIPSEIFNQNFGDEILEQGVAEGQDDKAEAYRAHLIKTLPQIMKLFANIGKGWIPSKEQMLSAVDTAYIVMKHTGDVKQAGKVLMDELNTLYRMSQGKQGVAEDQKINLDTDYFMNEGCGIFAVATALNEPGSQIYIISNKEGESWSKSFPYEITHVFANIPGKGQHDVRGKRSLEEMASDFGLDKGDYSVKGPFDPKEFFTKFMGNSDSKPLYGTVKDIKQVQKQIQPALKQGVAEGLDEAFDQPYPMAWEKSEADDSMDALAQLPDGSNLSIMFNMEYDEEGEEVIQVEFHRNNSQEVTGEGDAQKVFATVLSAIQQFIVKYKPLKIYFSASKEPAPIRLSSPAGAKANPESRAKLYDRLVMRYARTWGYRPLRADTGSIVRYELSRLKPVQGVAEGWK